MTDTSFPISGAYRHMVRLTYSGSQPIKVGGFAQWLYGMTDTSFPKSGAYRHMV